MFKNLFQLTNLYFFKLDNRYISSIRQSEENVKKAVESITEDLKNKLDGMYTLLTNQNTGDIANRNKRLVASAIEHHRRVVNEHFPHIPLDTVEQLCAMNVALTVDHLAVSVVSRLVIYMYTYISQIE